MGKPVSGPIPYPKWVTDPKVGPVVVMSAEDEAVVLSGKAVYEVTVAAPMSGGTTYRFIGAKSTTGKP